jgi:hypothetical protein
MEDEMDLHNELKQRRRLKRLVDDACRVADFVSAKEARKRLKLEKRRLKDERATERKQGRQEAA